MESLAIYTTTILAAVAATFAIMTFLRAIRMGGASLQNQISSLLRDEGNLIRQATDDGARNLRQELNHNLLAFQETTLKAFRELGDSLANQIKEFGLHLEHGSYRRILVTSGVRRQRLELAI